MNGTPRLKLLGEPGSARPAKLILPLCAVFVAHLALPAQEYQPINFDVRQASGPACATPVPPAYGPPHGAPCPPPEQPCPPKHVFVRLPPCEDEGYPETAPGGGYPETAGGAFAAPPQTGAAVQATSRVGIRGFALRLPEIRLEMPTLELPSIVRSRRSAHMEIDRAVAPYIQAPVTGYAQTSMAMRQMAAPQRFEATRETAPPAEMASEPETDADEFRRRCEALDALHADLRQKQQCLDQKLMQVDGLLRELEHNRRHPHGRPEAVSPMPPTPQESLPMPMQSRAREYPVEATSHSVNSHAATTRPAASPPRHESPTFLSTLRQLPLLGGESR